MRYEQRKREDCPEFYDNSQERHYQSYRQEAVDDQQGGTRVRDNGYSKIAARRARRRSASPCTAQGTSRYAADTQSTSLVSSADRSNRTPSEEGAIPHRAQDSPVSSRSATPSNGHMMEAGGDYVKQAKDTAHELALVQAKIQAIEERKKLKEAKVRLLQLEEEDDALY